MNEWPILALIFTATAAVAFLLMSVINLWNREEETTGEEPAPRLFGPFTPVVAGFLPQSVAGRDSTRKVLLQAGYYEPVALVNFQAVRSVMTYLPLVGGEAGAVLTDGPVSVAFFLVGLFTGVLGYAMPWLILAVQADRRTEHVRRGLPMFMDTMGLTLSTGASLPAAFASSGEAIRRGHPELAHEARVVSAHAPMRSLSHALEQWKDRQPIPELGSLVFLLSQADRFGADITSGLWELSSSLQTNARQRAEAAANKANFYMVFPTVLCLLIAAGLMLAGPGIVQLVDSNRQVEGYLQQAREQEEKLKNDELIRNGARSQLAAKPTP
jgi:tight adherence protein C